MAVHLGYTEYRRTASDATGETAPRGGTYVDVNLTKQ